jgi:hypothetical protein
MDQASHWKLGPVTLLSQVRGIRTDMPDERPQRSIMESLVL